MLRRAAVMGTVAHAANKSGQAKGQQEAAAQAAPAQAAPAPQEDPYEALKKAKDLLDQGILTQEEFDAQKAKILATT
jgi:membrane protease subunit (stomatin/prohibitin family)